MNVYATFQPWFISNPHPNNQIFPFNWTIEIRHRKDEKWWFCSLTLVKTVEKIIEFSLKKHQSISSNSSRLAFTKSTATDDQRTLKCQTPSLCDCMGTGCRFSRLGSYGFMNGTAWKPMVLRTRIINRCLQFLNNIRAKSQLLLRGARITWNQGLTVLSIFLPRYLEGVLFKLSWQW